MSDDGVVVAVDVPYIRVDVADKDDNNNNNSSINLLSFDTIVAGALGVNLELDGSKIPFVSPEILSDKLAADRTTKSRRLLLLYGTAGCGKTRCLFELIKLLELPKRIYIVNPRYDHSCSQLFNGKINKMKASLADIVDECRGQEEDDVDYGRKIGGGGGANAIIVWDDFPEGLEKQSSSSSSIRDLRQTIDVLASSGIKVYASISSRYLKSDGLEMIMDIASKSSSSSSSTQNNNDNNNNIGSALPDIDVLPLMHDPSSIAMFLNHFGTNMPGFEQAFEKSVKPVLGKTSEILWNAEPTPCTVLEYLQQLTSKTSLTSKEGGGEEEKQKDEGDRGGGQKEEWALAVAKSLASKSSSSYYEGQYALLAEKQRNDIEFLYALWLCYELGLDRALQSIIRIQQTVYGTKPSSGNISNMFQLGIYLDGDQICLHGIAKNSIPILPENLRKMISFVACSYSWLVLKNNKGSRDIVGDGSGNNNDNDYNNVAYLAGRFVGRNSDSALSRDLIALLPADDEAIVVDDDDCDLNILQNRFYQISLGHGIGSKFDRLDAQVQNRIFQSAMTSTQFSRSLGEGIGWTVADNSRSSASETTPTCVSSSASCNANPVALLDTNIFNYAKKNPLFSAGLGTGLGMTFPRLSSKIKKEIFVEAEGDPHFAAGLGEGIGFILEFVPLDEHLWVFRTVDSNSEFARGLGTGLGRIFVSLPQSIQTFAKSLVAQNPRFAKGLGTGLGDAFAYLPQDIQKTAVNIAKINSEFAKGLGIGMGNSFSYLSSDLYKEITNIFSRQQQQEGGEGEVQEKKKKKKKNENSSFDCGLGVGLGSIFYYLCKEAQNTILAKAFADPNFALGLGEGYGLSYALLPAKLQGKVISKMAESATISFGFGAGLGSCFDCFDDEQKKKFEMLAAIESDNDDNKNIEFARGLGYGFGRTFMFHDSSCNNKKEVIISKMSSLGENFASGVGEGFGSAFSYMSKDMIELIFDVARSDCNFARGLGIGIGTAFAYFNYDLRENVTSKVVAISNPSLREGMKDGFKRAWQYLDKDDQKFFNDFYLQSNPG